MADSQLDAGGPRSSLGAAGAFLAFLGVAAGAFGAHALKSRLDPVLLQIFETGARYQLMHALAMILAWVTLDRRPVRAIAFAGWMFGAGIVLFSGSLYALALSGVRMWGAVTPFGGFCFLTGWLAFGVGALKSRR